MISDLDKDKGWIFLICSTSEEVAPTRLAPEKPQSQKSRVNGGIRIRGGEKRGGGLASGYLCINGKYGFWREEYDQGGNLKGAGEIHKRKPKKHKNSRTVGPGTILKRL